MIGYASSQPASFDVEKEFGVLMVRLCDAHNEATVPMTLTAKLDSQSIVRERTGKISAATARVYAKWNSRHMRDVNWEYLPTSPLIIRSICAHIRAATGVDCRIAWTAIDDQCEGQFCFSIKPYLVDQLFDQSEAAGGELDHMPKERRPVSLRVI